MVKVTSKPARTRKAKISKAVSKKKPEEENVAKDISEYIPEEFVAVWDNDYYDLTEQQRLKMVDLYIVHMENYEIGTKQEKIRHPHFMGQRDVIKKEEDKKRKESLEKKRAEEEKRQKEVDELNKRYEKLEELRKVWEKNSLIILNREEQLGLENFNLKIVLVENSVQKLERDIIDLNTKKSELIEKQKKLAEEIAEKYEVPAGDYIIDPTRGVFTRHPDIKFPHTLRNISEEEE